MILLSRQNKKYNATKKSILLDIIRDRIKINNYAVYEIDIKKIIKDIIKRSGV